MKESQAKERIMTTATRLFYEQGYNSTGINQIIDEAEIARASLYKHFPSKKDLLNAYIVQAEKVWFTELDTFLEHLSDPKEKLLALFDYRLERQLRSDFGGCQFTRISSELAKEDISSFELVGHQKTRLKNYIKELIDLTGNRAQGSMAGDLLAETLFLLLEGATVSANIYKSSDAIRMAKQAAAQLI